MHDELFQRMEQAIIDGEEEIAADLAKQAIELGIDPLDAINKGFVVGVNRVGESFSCGDAFLPELVMAGEAMKAAIEVLEPELSRQGIQREMLGKVVVATVDGDIHDIGKTLVATMLSAAGFEVYDLGVSVPTPQIIEKAIEVDADLIGVSALLTTTMVRQRDLIEAVAASPLASKVKVMVGGAPVTREWVEEIRAHGYSEDAVGAVSVAKELLGKV